MYNYSLIILLAIDPLDYPHYIPTKYAVVDVERAKSLRS
jgi:hypothetical protein